MEPTSGKPPRKRRRWLIVACVLVLVSMGTWWYWPRGDARFVGKWRAEQVPDPNTGETAYWNLAANGTGSVTFVAATDTARVYFPWTVENGRLVTGRDYSSQSFKEIDWFIHRWLGYAVSSQKSEYMILSVGSDEMMLECTDRPSRVILHRIPE